MTTTSSKLKPIRKPAIVTRPVTNAHPDLLRLLLEKIRHIDKSQAGPKSGICQQTGGQNTRNSDSAAQPGLVSSESSDES